MKKQVWLGIAFLVVLALAATPVMAAGGQNQRVMATRSIAQGHVMPVMATGSQNQLQWQGNMFALVGKVTAVDSTAKTITVQVYTGNTLVKSYVGKELTVQTSPTTLFLRYGETKCEVITFGDVAVGMYISVHGKVVTGAFLAERVTVDVPLHYQNSN